MRGGMFEQVPHLMAGALRLGEDGDEQIPLLLVEEIDQEPRLQLDAGDQMREQRLIRGGRGVVFVARGAGGRADEASGRHRVRPVAGGQLRRQERRLAEGEAFSAEGAIVGAPLRKLDAVEAGFQRPPGIVDHRDPGGRIGCQRPE